MDSQRQQHLYYDVPHPDGAISQSKAARARRMVIAGAATLLVLASGGYIFGYYIPHQPDSILKTALKNTSAGYDHLVDYVTDEAVAKDFENTKMTGSYKVAGPGLSTDGAMSAHTDGSNMSFSGDIGLATTRLMVEGITKDAANSASPDLYLKAGGIKGLGAMYGLPELDTLDNQWIVIDHTLFDTFARQAEQAQGLGVKDKAVIPPKREDMLEAAAVLGVQADKYLFSSDADTAVVRMDRFVGSEVVDGKQTNHYKVAINKDHLKAFVKDLGAQLDKTGLSEWSKQAYDMPLSEMLNIKDAQSSVDGVKASDRYDLWVNTKTMLIHKMRFADRRDAAHNYMEFGFNYGGGDEKPFFMTVADNKDGVEGKGTFGLSINTKTNVIKFGVDGTDRPVDGSGQTDITLDVTFEPSNDKVNTTVPAEAISLSEALDRVGLTGYLDALSQSLSQLEDLGADPESVDPFTISL
ncbi:MAG TPA: hypothetical protein VFT16_01410 [Candidatus Saccharimonadales bacterium]|nr:hypothetical protein [Candidatus Saccharimonadales bacterium]